MSINKSILTKKKKKKDTEYDLRMETMCKDFSHENALQCPSSCQHPVSLRTVMSRDMGLGNLKLEDKQNLGDLTQFHLR